MKRKNCIILFLLGMVFVAKSQIIITTPYEFTFGGSGGTTFSTVSFSPRILQNNKIGSTFGLTGRITMGKFVGLQLEMNFAQQGWKERYDPPEDEENTTTPTINYHYSRLLNYIQMPFYTHIQFGGAKVKGFINAGPQIGYLMGESTKENLHGAQPGKINMQHEMIVQNKFEWGISGGGGIEIRTGIGYFLLEGRYLYSLGDIYHTRQEDYFSKASTQTISIKLSYLFPLK